MPDGTTIVCEKRDVAVDRAGQSFTRDLRLRLVRDGVEVRTEVHRLVLRWYGAHELCALLEAAGFVDVRFEERPLWGGDPFFVYTAVRP